MKILIVSHGYAPALNARAFRWTALAEYWGKQGHEVDVITVRTGGSNPPNSTKGVTVHRVGFYLQQLSVRARHSAHSETTSPVRRSSIRSFAGRAAIRIAKRVHDLTWKKLYWPDYALPWIPFAALEARRIIARKRPDVVITISLPFSSHVVGYLSVPSRKIPWIVDVGDPFSFMTSTPTNNHSLYSRLNAFAERAVIRRAAAVTVTNEPTRSKYAGLFGNSGKLRVIPPMLSTLPVSAAANAEPANTLVFIGTLNRHIRNPDRLLAIFAELKADESAPGIELHFFGESGDCASSFQNLPGHAASGVKVHGLVSREEAMQAVHAARAVVNIGNATSFQLPSKLVEYAASGRPIVNLSAGKDDLSLEFLSGVPHVLTLSGEKSVAEAARMIAEFLQNLPKPFPKTSPPDWLSRFSVETIARSYLEPIIQNAALPRDS